MGINNNFDGINYQYSVIFKFLVFFFFTWYTRTQILIIIRFPKKLPIALKPTKPLNTESCWRSLADITACGRHRCIKAGKWGGILKPKRNDKIRTMAKERHLLQRILPSENDDIEHMWYFHKVEKKNRSSKGSNKKVYLRHLISSRFASCLEFLAPARIYSKNRGNRQKKWFRPKFTTTFGKLCFFPQIKKNFKVVFFFFDKNCGL